MARRSARLAQGELRREVGEEQRLGGHDDKDVHHPARGASQLAEADLENPVPPEFGLPGLGTCKGPAAVGEKVETIAGSPILADHVLSIAESSREREGKKPRQDTSITFGSKDFEGLMLPHQDPLVITAIMGTPCYNIKRILVDIGSSVDVLYMKTLQSMRLTKEHLSPAAGPVYGFDNRPVEVQGAITLQVTLGSFPKQATHNILFVVVDSDSAYNAIFGRPLQIIFGAIPSVPHLSMKFPTAHGTGIVRGSQGAAHSCNFNQTRRTTGTALSIDDFDLRDEAALQRASPVEGLVSVALSHQDPSRVVQIGSLLTQEEQNEYITFLRANVDVFAWGPEDMPGVDPGIIAHSLNINPACRPVIQKKRSFAPERLQDIEEEVKNS